MHFVERYALGCGIKIGNPYIYEKFFPLTVDKYITIHTTSKDSKNYDYWQEVVDILHPILEKHNIHILQIGGKQDKKLSFVQCLIGQTTLNQIAYIVKKSLLHVGTDSFPVHFASGYDIPIVALYSNSFPRCAGPYWGNPEKHVLLEPDRSGFKPSFSYTEFPKRINLIAPEKIASEVCRLLNIPFQYNYTTAFVGSSFGQFLLETVPNHVVNLQQFGTDGIVIRMDFQFNEECLVNWLSSAKCSIVTNKPINIQILASFKPSLIDVNYEITKDHNPTFVYNLQKLGIKCSLFSALPPKEVEALLLDYMDFGIIHPYPSIVPENLINQKDLFYKSSKFTLSNGKIFPSKYAFLSDKPIAGISNHLVPVPAPDDPHYKTFWTEQRHFRIVQKI